MESLIVFKFFVSVSEEVSIFEDIFSLLLGVIVYAYGCECIIMFRIFIGLQRRAEIDVFERGDIIIVLSRLGLQLAM